MYENELFLFIYFLITVIVVFFLYFLLVLSFFFAIFFFFTCLSIYLYNIAWKLRFWFENWIALFLLSISLIFWYYCVVVFVVIFSDLLIWIWVEFWLFLFVYFLQEKNQIEMCINVKWNDSQNERDQLLLVGIGVFTLCETIAINGYCCSLPLAPTLSFDLVRLVVAFVEICLYWLSWSIVAVFFCRYVHHHPSSCLCVRWRWWNKIHHSIIFVILEDGQWR